MYVCLARDARKNEKNETKNNRVQAPLDTRTVAVSCGKLLLSVFHEEFDFTGNVLTTILAVRFPQVLPDVSFSTLEVDDQVAPTWTETVEYAGLEGCKLADVSFNHLTHLFVGHVGGETVVAVVELDLHGFSFGAPPDAPWS